MDFPLGSHPLHQSPVRRWQECMDRLWRQPILKQWSKSEAMDFFAAVATSIWHPIFLCLQRLAASWTSTAARRRIAMLCGLPGLHRHYTATPRSTGILRKDTRSLARHGPTNRRSGATDSAPVSLTIAPTLHPQAQQRQQPPLVERHNSRSQDEKAS